MATPGHDKTVTGNPLPRNPATGGASYAYVVPLPFPSFSTFYQEPRPTVFYEPSPPPLATSPFLRRFLAAFIAIITIIILIVLITWFVLKPRFPGFRVDSATVTSLNSTGPYLTATWNITLVATNPNSKLALSYDTVSASVLYGDVSLIASTRMPPFKQETGSETTLRAQLSVVDEFVGDGLGISIASDRAHGLVQFGLSVWAWVSFKAGLLRSSDYLLKVYCDPLSFAFSPNNVTGTLIDPVICE